MVDGFALGLDCGCARKEVRRAEGVEVVSMFVGGRRVVGDGGRGAGGYEMRDEIRESCFGCGRHGGDRSRAGAFRAEELKLRRGDLVGILAK